VAGMMRPSTIALAFAGGMVLMWLALPVLYPPWKNPDQPAFSDLRKFTTPPEGDDAAMKRFAALEEERAARAETLIGDRLHIITFEERRSTEWFVERGAAFVQKALVECHLILHSELYRRYVAALGEDKVDKTVRYSANLKQRTSCANAYRAEAALKGIKLDF
jgi:hypothetical protein